MAGRHTVPGVYVDYVELTPEQELQTGVPLFIGLQPAKSAATALAAPTRIGRWEQFVALGVDPRSYLWPAVRGFFANGGGDCFVLTRVSGEGQLAALIAALATCERLEEIDLICAPDIWCEPERVLDQQAEVLAHCTRCGDRFAILDGPPGDREMLLRAYIEQLPDLRRLCSPNGAIYGPWLYVAGSANPVPPCGHMAGVYAAIDRMYGPHRAPANVALEDVIGIGLRRAPSLSDQELLAEHSLNSLRAFTGRGIRAWGASTLAGREQPEWRMIGARRLIISAKRWAARQLEWVTFEPNTPRLWGQVRRELERFCAQLLARGALQGDSPAEAYCVKCDAENNPPELREHGELVVDLRLAPSVANEFVIVQIVYRPDGVSVREPPV